jgi:hypothetical protein
LHHIHEKRGTIKDSLEDLYEAFRDAKTDDERKGIFGLITQLKLAEAKLEAAEIVTKAGLEALGRGSGRRRRRR